MPTFSEDMIWLLLASFGSISRSSSPSSSSTSTQKSGSRRTSSSQTGHLTHSATPPTGMGLSQEGQATDISKTAQTASRCSSSTSTSSALRLSDSLLCRLRSLTTFTAS